MQIDWLTVTAQIINFLVLVYLLKRFLYGPIIRAMDLREEKIAKRLDEANDKAREAEREIDAYQARRRNLEAERQDVLGRAKQEAEVEGRARLDELRHEIDRKRSQWLAELQHEQEAFLRQVRETVGKQVTGVTRQALRELAEAELEQQVVQCFRRRIESLSTEEKEELVQTRREPSAGLTVATVFALDETERGAILDQLRRTLGVEVDVQFIQRPELICGIALETPGRRWVWSVESYLAGLEAEFTGMLAQSTSTKATPHA